MFVHCVSYSKLLEILTSMLAIKDHNSPLPPGIQVQGNEVIHFWWDNFDLSDKTAFGAGTHGLVMQERTTGVDFSTESRPDIPKTKQRSAICADTVLGLCIMRPHVGPTSDVQISTPVNTLEVLSDTIISDTLCILCRTFCGDNAVPVPGWGGWISLRGDRGQAPQTTVEYIPTMNAPITKNSTVMHILEISQEAPAAVGQPYTVVAFDLAAAKKAYSTVWSYPYHFNNIIIRLGAFHMSCAYIGYISKLIKGSGIELILVELSVCQWFY